jgi:hypothetical protein
MAASQWSRHARQSLADAPSDAAPRREAGRTRHVMLSPLSRRGIGPRPGGGWHLTSVCDQPVVNRLLPLQKSPIDIRKQRQLGALLRHYGNEVATAIAMWPGPAAKMSDGAKQRSPTTIERSSLMLTRMMR